MSDNHLAKYYAAYRSGCLGSNIIEAYFPLLANIICEEKITIIKDNEIAILFQKKYDISLPLPFIRQILSHGISNGSIIEDHGTYVADKVIKKYQFDNRPFESQWTALINNFRSFCVEHNYEIGKVSIEKNIISSLEITDEQILLNEELSVPEDQSSFSFAWYKFIKDCSENNIVLFNYIASISFSNIIQKTLFFAGDGIDSYKGLHVYLDTPIVLALLRMDVEARYDSCTKLLREMQDAGCITEVLDHNYTEIEGLIERAIGWANSTDYDISKANNIAKYFHDSGLSSTEISAYCSTLSAKLNNLGISIRETEYDSEDNSFQEDENSLYKMIETKYKDNNKSLLHENIESIHVDVRSIIMVYRLRQGKKAVQVQAAGHILITLNSTIANVCKQYENNTNPQTGNIPSCISMDLFGSILWLFSPVKAFEYKKLKLLADCYIALKPSKELLKRYVDSLILAKNAGEIDEKVFLFLRSHCAVNDALMNVTKGDYAKFNERTYLEVYNDIMEKAESKYIEEHEKHQDTIQALDTERKKSAALEETFIEYQKQQDLKNNNMMTTIQSLQNEELLRKERNAKIIGSVVSIVLLGIPYIVIIAIIDIFKSQFQDLSIFTIIKVSILVVVPILLCFIYKSLSKKIILFIKKKLI